MKRKAQPASEAELLARARALAGDSLGELAERLGIAEIPRDLRRDKGWIGELLERELGASAGSLPQPDFPKLGVELKTIPVRADGQPTESTHVCSVPLADSFGMSWDRSPVRRKLRRVLWIPIEAQRAIPVNERRIGNPLLWSPSDPQEQQLKLDWEELMRFIGLGEVDQLSANHGVYLQVRPKAADSRALTPSVGPQGTPAMTLPRGFYLRASFTAEILRGAYL